MPHLRRSVLTRCVWLPALSIGFAFAVFADDKLNQRLSEAVSFGEAGEIAGLVKEGADPNLLTAGMPLITRAAVNGAVEVIDALIAAQADPDLKDDVSWTALMRAAELGEKGAVRALIRGRADVNAKSESGKSPLSVATGKGQDEIVELLKAHGAQE